MKTSLKNNFLTEYLSRIYTKLKLIKEEKLNESIMSSLKLFLFNKEWNKGIPNEYSFINLD